MKIALCCQWYKSPGHFPKALKGLEEYKLKDRVYLIDGHLINFLDCKSTNTYDGRNSLIYGALDVPIINFNLLPYDAWVFFDTDVIWTKEHLMQMINSSADVFMLPYQLRGREAYNNAILKEGKYRHFLLTAKGQKEIDGGGAGAMKVSRKVLQGIKPLAFYPVLKEADGKVSILPCDYSFCSRVREKGFKILCNFDTPVGHLPI